MKTVTKIELGACRIEDGDNCSEFTTRSFSKIVASKEYNELPSWVLRPSEPTAVPVDLSSPATVVNDWNDAAGAKRGWTAIAEEALGQADGRLHNVSLDGIGRDNAKVSVVFGGKIASGWADYVISAFENLRSHHLYQHSPGRTTHSACRFVVSSVSYSYRASQQL
jgi:hypothetical protein